MQRQAFVFKGSNYVQSLIFRNSTGQCLRFLVTREMQLIVDLIRVNGLLGE